MSQKQFEKDLLRFINTHILKGGDKTVGETSRLFDDRIIDSLKILDLIAFIEKRLRITITDREIIMKNFASVRTMSKAFHNYSRKPQKK